MAGPRDSSRPLPPPGVVRAVNAIEVERLTKRFRPIGSYRDLLRYRWQAPSHPAVAEVSFEVHRGELFGLLGENGAGKSTLIRMLSTTLLPTSGHARVAGFDVVTDPRSVRRSIGLVSGDERSFFWRLTGRQNLRYFAALYHVRRDVARTRIDELLELLGVAQYADERYATLSTGTRQKFAIARGMMTEPEILFLDEPTRALDPIAADDLREYVARHIVGELGRTVILATHSLSEAEAACHRVAILRAGQMVELGTVPELSARHGLGDTLELEGPHSLADVRAALAQTPGVVEVTATDEHALPRVAVRLRSASAVNDALGALLRSGVALSAVTTRKPTLTDIYRATYASS